MTISGKNEIDWQGFKEALGAIQVIDKVPLVKQKSRDFFWYSPVLKRRLSGSFGDLVVRPHSSEELIAAMKLAYQWRIPVTLRGGGTGNYGQAVPLEGGLIIEMTGLNPAETIEALLADTEIIRITHMFLHEWPVVRELCEHARARFPDAKIVLGGENSNAFWPHLFQL